jgi:hypothetical protein
VPDPNTTASLIPSRVIAAVVTDVNPQTWMMELRSEFGGKFLGHTPITSLYLHPFDGEGIHVVPEVGARLWVCLPSDGGMRPVPLVYRSLSDEGASQRSNRPLMNPGDISLTTRDRNGIKIRRGGVVEIFSTPIARTLYLPKSNEILSICENWNLQTFGGSIDWRTARAEEDPDGNKGTTCNIEFKEYADQPSPAIRIKAGKTEDGSLFDLQAFQDSTVSEDNGTLNESVSIHFDRQGNFSLQTFQEAPSQEGQELESSVLFSFNNAGEAKFEIPPTGQVAVFSDETKTEGVVLGKTFLTQLQKALLEIQVAMGIVGAPTAQVALLISEITLSLAEEKGTGPYIAPHLRTDNNVP